MNYDYFRGLIFTGLDMFKEAIHSFRLVTQTPHQMCHEYQLQAAKKIILLHLLTANFTLDQQQ